MDPMKKRLNTTALGENYLLKMKLLYVRPVTTSAVKCEMFKFITRCNKIGKLVTILIMTNYLPSTLLIPAFER